MRTTNVQFDVDTGFFGLQDSNGRTQFPEHMTSPQETTAPT